MKDQKRQQAQNRVVERIKLQFKQEKEVFEEDNIKLLISDPPKKSPFPLLIFILAVMKDFFDILDLSIIGIIFTFMASFGISIILFIWGLGKLGGGWWKTRLIGFLWRRYLAMFILEFIPFFKIVPATSIFILMVVHRENKIVKLFNKALEELKKAGF